MKEVNERIDKTYRVEITNTNTVTTEVVVQDKVKNKIKEATKKARRGDGIIIDNIKNESIIVKKIPTVSM